MTDEVLKAARKDVDQMLGGYIDDDGNRRKRAGVVAFGLLKGSVSCFWGA